MNKDGPTLVLGEDIATAGRACTAADGPLERFGRLTYPPETEASEMVSHACAEPAGLTPARIIESGEGARLVTCRPSRLNLFGVPFFERVDAR